MQQHPHISDRFDRRRRRAFTIVELLVVIGIIIALLGILIVALNTAARRAASAKTQVLLTSISQGLVRFQTDMGYLPPILGVNGTVGPTTTVSIGTGRDLIQPPTWAVSSGNGVPTQASIDALQDWFSITSLPEYLLGYGDRRADGYGAVGPIPATPSGSPGAGEIPLLGLRSPGTDGVWGALLNPHAPPGLGLYSARNTMPGVPLNNVNASNSAQIVGRVYGPYVDLKDESSIAAIRSFDINGEPIIVESDDPDFDTLPRVFVDYWGQPIHYYRRAYALGDIKGPDATPTGLLPGVRPTLRDLGDIFALRPYEYRPGEEKPGVADANGDATTLSQLKGASFALMSRGGDKTWVQDTRRDENGFNRDNLVEFGQ